MTYAERRMAVFRVGEHTDSQGRTKTWTRDDLEKIVSSYNPEHHEAPIVIGHPKDNSPAYGWVKGLELDADGVLWANTNILDEFDELAQKGIYKKRSISLYDNLSLRHIGFLGGQPPAVKGLPDLQFAAGEGVTIEFMATTINPDEPVHHDRDRHPGSGKHHTTSQKEGMYMPLNIKDLFKEFVASLKSKGVEIADDPVTYTEDDLVARVEAAKVEAKKQADAEFAEERKRLETELATARQVEKTTMVARLKDFAEQLQAKGHVTPAQAKSGIGIVAFMEALCANDGAIEFAEGDAKKSQTVLEWFKSFAESLSQVEMSRKVKREEVDLSPAAEKIEKLISEKQAANKDLSYSQAFAEVQRENPELTTEYASEFTAE